MTENNDKGNKFGNLNVGNFIF